MQHNLKFDPDTDIYLPISSESHHFNHSPIIKSNHSFTNNNSKIKLFLNNHPIIKWILFLSILLFLTTYIYALAVIIYGLFHHQSILKFKTEIYIIIVDSFISVKMTIIFLIINYY